MIMILGQKTCVTVKKYLLILLYKYRGIEGINPKYFLVRNGA